MNEKQIDRLIPFLMGVIVGMVIILGMAIFHLK